MCWQKPSSLTAYFANLGNARVPVATLLDKLYCTVDVGNNAAALTLCFSGSSTMLRSYSRDPHTESVSQELDDLRQPVSSYCRHDALFN